MSLLIDIGNTRVKFGYTHSSSLDQDQYCIALPHHAIADLLPWLQKHNLKPKHALGISVASITLKEQIAQLLLSIQCESQWLDATTPCSLLVNHYDLPERLGADRWLGLIGIIAKQHAKPSTAIIHASFGTATTIDIALPSLTDQRRQFVGGLILPGPQLMYDSLALNTAQLGNGRGDIVPFPANTRAAISSGIASAQAGAVWRQWHLTYERTGTPPLLVCSGGGWDLVQAEIKGAYTEILKRLQLPIDQVLEQPTPALDGLAFMATDLH